ncbi:WUSCHEL-related homeobox 13-like [Lotus japonicus]|uniref:WUSCHEL-related homeobox 13-like n=1 Tax=Lotus japonicus TaxID=34305 RepID=UPI002590CE92|nr:WUSCHEL-related homeobox 13-like [Lotus japonicus]
MVNLMEWKDQLQMWQQQNGNVNVGVQREMMYVKVMTDEQLETLRKQIAVYATICEQLIEMHRTFSTQQDLAGVRLGNIYFDPLMTSSGHKLTSRQRWNPTPIQLQILESIFDQGNGTPNKEKIKEMAADLVQHGQVSETNVYNWFQNRRARSKRKLQNVAPSTTESEADTEVDSKDRKTKPEEFYSQQNNVTTEVDLQCLNDSGSNNKPYSMFPSDGSLSSTRKLSHVPVFDGVLSNSRSDYQTGKMGEDESYNLYKQAGDYNMEGRYLG